MGCLSLWNSVVGSFGSYLFLVIVVILICLAKAAAATVVEEEPEEQKDYNEAEYTNGAEVSLELISVQKDLKIKFNNKKTGKLISNVPFNVTITDPNGKSETWTDDDMDGIIYKKGITPGNYTVSALLSLPHAGIYRYMLQFPDS